MDDADGIAPRGCGPHQEILWKSRTHWMSANAVERKITSSETPSFIAAYFPNERTKSPARKHKQPPRVSARNPMPSSGSVTTHGVSGVPQVAAGSVVSADEDGDGEEEGDASGEDGEDDGVPDVVSVSGDDGCDAVDDSVAVASGETEEAAEGDAEAEESGDAVVSDQAVSGSTKTASAENKTQQISEAHRRITGSRAG